MYRKDVARTPTFRLYLKVFELKVFATSSKRPKEGLCLLLSGELELDNSSLQPDRDSMGPILSVELREYVRDVAFHAGLAD